MRIPLYQVDAFAARLFGGNPAAVCLLGDWLEDRLLQSIALENNLSETAFLVRRGDCYDLRWFTPKMEVDLCGHATLASAFVVFEYLERDRETVRFLTRSGELSVRRDGELLSMDFPARAPTPCALSEDLARALGAAPAELWESRDYMAVFESEEQVCALEPDMAALAAVGHFAVMVTAPGKDADFVSRFFAPCVGIPEDPVTGSAHCTLVPYWANRLGKTKLYARQVSPRGGELWCEHAGGRVRIAGRAVRYLEGIIYA